MSRFKIWCPDLGQEQSDAQACSAIDEQGAVEEWAEWSDSHSADYDIVGGKERKVSVLNLDTSEISEWTVTGESLPIYRARPVLVQHI